MVWYEQIKPNTLIKGGRHADAIQACDSPVLAQNLMDPPGRIPRANEAWADIVA